MIKVTLQGLWARKRRLLGTVFAIFLGVAFLTGTLALSDTLQANFNRLFANANAGTDAVVQSATSITRLKPAQIPASVLGEVRGVAGVADAQPVVSGYGELLGTDGKAIGGNGAPRQAANWIPDPALNPYHLVEGRAPQAADEVVINRGAARTGHLHVGDTTVVQVPQPVRVRVVGIATFGTADGFGPATYVAFTFAQAQQLLVDGQPTLSSISVKAAAGVTPDELATRIQHVVPAGVEAITGAQLSADNVSQVDAQFLDGLRTFLVVFAAIALLVAAFTIHNTLSILVAQRTRESALLRALGATRRQTLRSVLAESLLVGMVASAAGVVGGVGVAGLLKALFDVVGFALPAGGLVLTPATVAIGLAVGVGVTAVAGLTPALQASRVPPLAALRENATERAAPRTRRLAAGAVLTAIGVAVVVSAVTGSGGGTLGRAGLGALVVIGGVVTLGPAIAGPIIGGLTAPLERRRGFTGALARQNAVRNPRRTSATAAALMVGVAVVTLFTVFAASLKSSLTQGVSKSVRADLVISGRSYGGGELSPSLADAVAALPQVADVAGIGQGDALIGGHTEQVSVLDPKASAAVLDLDTVSGTLAALGADQLAVSQATATAKGWRLGTAARVTFPDGDTQTMTVAALYRSTGVVGDYVVAEGAWAAHAAQNLDGVILIAVRPSAALGAAEAAVTKVAEDYGAPTVETRQGYVAAVGSRINAFLGLIYVMLALAILIALLGIANALTLSAHERTRELGLLRAIGQTRAQLRAMVRWESVTVAAFGTLGGLAVGIFLGWALVKAAAGSPGFAGTATGFSAPYPQLLIILVVGGLAGVLAAIRPARRAARLDVLAAIAAE